jgi:hypothetical protein
MRKVLDVKVPQWGGRDDGKTYRITEMSAMRAEKWAMRMAIALKGTQGYIPEDVARLGYIGVAIRGVNAILAADIDFLRVEPLLDEMMTCVEIVRDTKNVDRATGATIAHKIVTDDDIEEVRTRGWLRLEVLSLHAGFSIGDALSALISAVKRSELSSKTTQTSPDSSDSPSTPPA